MNSTSTLTRPQRIEKAQSIIARTKELSQFAPLVMFGDTKIGQCPTAYTDGRNIVMGSDFMDTLTDPELVFVLLHEALHIGFRHIVQWAPLWKQDAQLTNMACDYVINLPLLDLTKVCPHIAVPVAKDGEHKGERIPLIDEAFRGLNAKQVFDILKKEEEEQEQEQGDDPQDGESNDEPGDGEPNDEPGDGKGRGRGRAKGGQQFDEHDFAAGEELTQAEKDVLVNEVDQLIRQGNEVAGRMGGTALRELGDVIASKVDWREVLADHIRGSMAKGFGKTTWRRFNRRMQGAGIYMPSSYDDSFRRIVVGIDTSGSIDGSLLSAFLGNVQKVVEDVCPEELVLVYWDGRVQSVETYTAQTYGTLINTTKPKGGGGTDPSCVPTYLREHNLVEGTQCVLMLTDGYFGEQGDWSQLPAPLWCVTEGSFSRFAPHVGWALPIEV